ncbi:hypothetical protein BV210_10800 [Halorientalis sp. IM1011]|uniref:DUF445 domain-containing protein n=1 Tax=Halorientalis sp. IM1011 TaxID=1932360 RepID=UPI00097CD33E|nr:DUF445 family protein [Halorientalis sp. IM1011]AQL43175.1 hypothetical protein BV210_10800 [Halorientalis sp. IM1011]
MIPALDSVLASLPPLQWNLILIPPITGIIGYITNWVGIRLLFYPLEFRGVRVPGLKQLAPMLPMKIQQIPGILEGKVGWQGIIPSRSAKMGSVAYDSSIAKIANQKEFYERLDPDRIAQHMVAQSRENVHTYIDDLLSKKEPVMWNSIPDGVQQFIHTQVEQELPAVTERIMQTTAEHIDEVLSLKLMVIDYLDNHPELLNRMFLEVGEEELSFLVNSGFYFGTLLGVFSIPLYLFFDGAWWVLPMSGVFVGYFTNYIAIKAIFNPQEPIEIGPFTLQGLFIQRQEEVAERYGQIVAEEIITVENVAQNLLYGKRSDRTRRLIEEAIRPTLDEALGMAAPVVRVATGDRRYEEIRDALATEGVEYTLEPLKDEEFNRERAVPVKELIASRMQELPPQDFTMTLRSAFKEDEWLLIGIGAALGFVAGWVQLLVVTTV